MNGIKAQFPGLANNWHYLDTAATAQKPQVVLDAMMRAGGVDYATVHRGVYARSANMTVAFEAARDRVARFMGAASSNEIVFLRGATEGINLVAQSWGTANVKAGDRIMLSQLEHHSNIVPHKMVALAHVSNVLGSVLDARRAADAAHAVGAKFLLDGCQAAPRMQLDMADLACDFYVMSGHKLYGPTGIGVLWAHADMLEAMPPWQGGGAMIDRVTFEKTTYAPAPSRFEAGTPMIIEVIGLHTAIDFIDSFGPDAIFAHESALAAQARDALRSINAITLYGPEQSAGIVSFSMEGVHPHDIGTILDEEDVAIRAGHHCAQPLMDHLGVPATARASFGIYNDEDDVAALVRGLERVKRIFG